LPDASDELDDILHSMVEWCEDIEAIVSRTNASEFKNDKLFQLAIAKAVEQLGELARRVNAKHPEFARHNPELPFAEAAGIRNRLAHDYTKINLVVIWNTATVSVPALKLALQKFLA
jgi:uncharacterized protein with HEPN domain